MRALICWLFWHPAFALVTEYSETRCTLRCLYCQRVFLLDFHAARLVPWIGSTKETTHAA